MYVAIETISVISDPFLQDTSTKENTNTTYFKIMFQVFVEGGELPILMRRWV
jgi:hypothetical protein